jgi:hypothetical protein
LGWQLEILWGGLLMDVEMATLCWEYLLEFQWVHPPLDLGWRFALWWVNSLLDWWWVIQW